ncbi:MAG TPA: hypothetical protein VFM93_07825 [Candidatus Limnocylindria bacterium]|nr:hypothetical protein [Candidatus Limnocylindria bacterium]
MITLNLRSLVLALSIVLAVAIVGYGSYAYAEGLVPFGPRDDEWSGVFLTNGQAYFGHFYGAPGEYVILRDVHYVLATQLQSQDPNQQQGTQLTLQRLGSEIHGPTNEMRIAKTQILFIERLRPDSPLLAAIVQLRSAPPAAGTQAPRTVGPTAAPASPARTVSPSPSPR